MMLSMRQEREFLRLARDWLLARWMLMGNQCRKGWSYDPVGWQIGELGTHAEMHLLMKEATRDADDLVQRQVSA